MDQVMDFLPTAVVAAWKEWQKGVHDKRLELCQPEEFTML